MSSPLILPSSKSEGWNWAETSENIWTESRFLLVLRRYNYFIDWIYLFNACEIFWYKYYICNLFRLNTAYKISTTDIKYHLFLFLTYFVKSTQFKITCYWWKPLNISMSLLFCLKINRMCNYSSKGARRIQWILFLWTVHTIHIYSL